MERTPVDDAIRPVDPAALPEADKKRYHRSRIPLVEREPLTAVVERRAKPPVLHHDRPPRQFEPLPRPSNERLAAKIVPGQPLECKLLLDDVLRRDPRVVVAGLPQRAVAAHPVPAHEHVLDRAVEGVAEVEVAGDIRRRNTDDVALLTACAHACGVEPLGLPGFLPAGLDPAGLVDGLHRCALLHRQQRVYGAMPQPGCGADAGDLHSQAPVGRRPPRWNGSLVARPRSQTADRETTDAGRGYA